MTFDVTSSRKDNTKRQKKGVLTREKGLIITVQHTWPPSEASIVDNEARSAPREQSTGAAQSLHAKLQERQKGNKRKEQGDEGGDSFKGWQDPYDVIEALQP